MYVCNRCGAVLRARFVGPFGFPTVTMKNIFILFRKCVYFERVASKNKIHTTEKSRARVHACVRTYALYRYVEVKNKNRTRARTRVRIFGTDRRGR